MLTQSLIKGFGYPSRSDAIRILIGMGLFGAYEERKQAGRKEG